MIVEAKCPECDQTGLVESANAIRDGEAVIVYRCAACQHEWLALRRTDPNPDPTKRKFPERVGP